MVYVYTYMALTPQRASMCTRAITDTRYLVVKPRSLRPIFIRLWGSPLVLWLQPPPSLSFVRMCVYVYIYILVFLKTIVYFSLSRQTSLKPITHVEQNGRTDRAGGLEDGENETTLNVFNPPGESSSSFSVYGGKKRNNFSRALRSIFV